MRALVARAAVPEQPQFPPAGALTNAPIDEVFGPTGFLQRVPGYVHREGQVALAHGVDDAISKPGTILLAEAPTGTGKSIGYLVPAIWHAVHQRRRVVVVTANIALQEQLVSKDLPALKLGLPWSFEFALAKGIGNYLCQRRFQSEAADASFFGGFDDAASDKQWPDVMRWAGSTSLGDVSELPFEMTPKVRLRVTTTAEDCVGRKCKHYVDCGAMRARLAWQRADVLVTNYSLFFSDLAIRAETRVNGDDGTGVLPQHEVVIMDEGHNAADIARDFLGFKITPGQVRWAVRALAPRGKDAVIVDKRLQDRVHAASDAFFHQLEELERSDRYSIRLRRPDQFESGPLVSVLVEAANALTDASVLPMAPDKAEDARRGADRCRRIAATLRQAAALADPGTWVYFIEAGQGRTTTLVGKPVDVAPMLRDLLFDGKRSVVVTSATLAVNDSFDHVAVDLGADVVDELSVDSPFDWSTAALLVVPRGLEDPNGLAYRQTAADALVGSVRAARGRTLVLCTSYKMLGVFRDALLAARLPYTVLAQGEAPRTELLRRFREDVSSVLVGTSSFWEGVDVPGESLSCVVVGRIPFEHKEDSVVDSVSARTKAWFQKWMVPRAVVAMRQGVGRLIRSASDRGVVVVLDGRLISKSYGKQFLRSLPKMRLTRDVSEIGRFLS